MQSIAVLQEYLINSKAPKEVLNAMRSIDESLRKEMSDADMFLKSLAERDAEVVRLEKLNAEIIRSLEFWHNAWKELRQEFIKEQRNSS